MDDVFKKHMKRLPLYIFVFGLVIILSYFSIIASAQNPGRTLIVFAMLPFYIGCVILLSLVVWIVMKFFK